MTFTFRKKTRCFEPFIDDSEFPCYIFVILEDEELAAEFGRDVTLKTDFETLLPRQDDTPSLLALRQTIFDTLKTTVLFQQAKAAWQERQQPRYISSH